MSQGQGAPKANALAAFIPMSHTTFENPLPMGANVRRATSSGNPLGAHIRWVPAGGIQRQSFYRLSFFD